MILTDFNVCLSELLFLSGFRSLYLGIDVFAGKGHFWFNSNCADAIFGSRKNAIEG